MRMLPKHPRSILRLVDKYTGTHSFEKKKECYGEEFDNLYKEQVSHIREPLLEELVETTGQKIEEVAKKHGTAILNSRELVECAYDHSIQSARENYTSCRLRGDSKDRAFDKALDPIAGIVWAVMENRKVDHCLITEEGLHLDFMETVLECIVDEKALITYRNRQT